MIHRVITNRSTGHGSLSGFSSVFRHGHGISSFEAVFLVVRHAGELKR